MNLARSAKDERAANSLLEPNLEGDAEVSPQEIAKSIADELREQPELWVQGCGSTERGEPGCIMNHIAQRGADDYQLRHFWLAQIEEAEQVIPWDGATPSLSLWNDKPGRTARDIIALCDKVAAQS